MPLSRCASLFAFWAALWLAASIVALAIVFGDKPLPHWDGSARLSLGLLIAWLSMPTLMGAHYLWALFHRGGYRPGVGGYVLLALLVVLVSHLFGLAAPALLVTQLDGGSILSMNVLLLRMHGWLTVPTALVATGLFAWWARRRRPVVRA